MFCPSFFFFLTETHYNKWYHIEDPRLHSQNIHSKYKKKMLFAFLADNSFIVSVENYILNILEGIEFIPHILVFPKYEMSQTTRTYVIKLLFTFVACSIICN